jgi:hypothetical protein
VKRRPKEVVNSCPAPKESIGLTGGSPVAGQTRYPSLSEAADFGLIYQQTFPASPGDSPGNLKSPAAGHIKKAINFLVALFCQLSTGFLAKMNL